MKYNTRLFFTISLSVLFFLGTSQNTEWMTTSSIITFKIKNAGFHVSGKFGGLKTKIKFDASELNGSVIEATVDAATIDTDNGTRDGHLKKAEYFDANKFPLITMNSQRIMKQDDGSFKGYFKLELKGVTKNVIIPFTFFDKGGKGVFKGEFTINRLDYGIGTSSVFLSDNVTINLTVYVIKI